MDMNKPIILIGMMGVGKTTIGRALASHLGYGFFDSDRLIEAAEGRSVSTICQDDGEPYFRACEARVITPLLLSKNSVIACGGGAVTVPDLAESLFQSGFVICLTAPVAVIAQRVAGGQDRPLLQGQDVTAALTKKLDERKHLYKRAHIEVDTSRQDIPELVNHILHLISIYKASHT